MAASMTAVTNGQLIELNRLDVAMCEWQRSFKMAIARRVVLANTDSEFFFLFQLPNYTIGSRVLLLEDLISMLLFQVKVR